jgi:hypothetical protein
MTTKTSPLARARGAVVTETGDPNRPITIAEGRARVKRRRLTNAEFQAARIQATTVTGYDDKSPIWGKQLPEVVDMIEAEIDRGTAASLNTAKQLLGQLKARAITRKLIGQARS